MHATGKVLGDIIAREVVICGQVKGNVQAKERIEITKDGALCGDIVTERVTIEDGAYFKGSIEIDKSSIVERAEKQSLAKAAQLRAAAER